jgi:hypothetical protein
VETSLVNVCRPVGAFGVSLAPHAALQRHPPELGSLSVGFNTSTIASLTFRLGAERVHHLAMDQAWFAESRKILRVLIERDGLRQISNTIDVKAA